MVLKTCLMSINILKHLETPWLPACWIFSSSLSLRQRLSRTGHRLFQRGFLGRLLGRLLGRPRWNRGIVESTMIEMTRQTPKWLDRLDENESVWSGWIGLVWLVQIGLRLRVAYSRSLLSVPGSFKRCWMVSSGQLWSQLWSSDTLLENAGA